MLDVREPSEWHHGHIDGRRAHPADRAPDRLDELPTASSCSWSARSAAGRRRPRRTSAAGPRRGQPRRRDARLGRRPGRPMVGETGRRPPSSDGGLEPGAERPPAIERAGSGHGRARRRSRARYVARGRPRPRRAWRGGRSATGRRAAGGRRARRAAGPPARPAPPWRRPGPGGTSTPRRTARRPRRRTARRPARRRARPRPSAPSPARAAGCTPPRCPSSIQPPSRAGSAQPATTSANAVSTRISKRRADWRSDRVTRSPSSGSTPRSHRRPPAPSSRRRTLVRRHREQPAAVGREQRAGLEVGADAPPGRRRPAVGEGERPGRGGGSTGTRSWRRVTGRGRSQAGL